jgi:hypothetical protein
MPRVGPKPPTQRPPPEAPSQAAVEAICRESIAVALDMTLARSGLEFSPEIWMWRHRVIRLSDVVGESENAVVEIGYRI